MPGWVGGGYVHENYPNFVYVRPYCKTQTGKQLNLYAHCNGIVEGVRGKCAGKSTCPGNKGHQNDGSTTPCSCDGNKYFDECDDPCNKLGLAANGGYCEAEVAGAFPEHYYVKDKCKTETGISIKYWAKCNGIDCEGNRGPCYGKTACDSSTIAVDPCTCGGLTYGSSCVIKCPYEQTAADCKAGQTFTQRCKDNSGIWFGECK